MYQACFLSLSSRPREKCVPWIFLLTVPKLLWTSFVGYYSDCPHERFEIVILHGSGLDFLATGRASVLWSRCLHRHILLLTISTILKHVLYGLIDVVVGIADPVLCKGYVEPLAKTTLAKGMTAFSKAINNRSVSRRIEMHQEAHM